MEPNDEPKSKRPKTETDVSTSSKPQPKDPFLTLPSEILPKIIANTTIAQWATLELLDKNFQAATFEAWRQLRNVNLEREFLINANDRSSINKSILQKLVELSPLLTSLSGINIRAGNATLNSDIVSLLTRFEHLQSITLGDEGGGLQLGTVVEFLESTRSRTSLKELKLFDVDQRHTDPASNFDRFATSFVNGREILSPLVLEKLMITSRIYPHYIRLDTVDASRLTELRVGQTRIEPQQLTNLIKRALNLRRIELSFLHCCGPCNGPRLQANKELLTALAAHENLSAIKFDSYGTNDFACLNFGGEFIGTLKAIGRRGQLRHLTIENDFLNPRVMDIDGICAAIRECIPYLQSISLSCNGISDVIVKLTELEEICVWSRVTPNAVEKIAQLPNLRRLAVDLLDDGDTNSLGRLADATTLTDVRIRFAHLISANVFEKWADGLGANLEILMLWGIAMKDDHDVKGLGPLLEKAVGLRVLNLEGYITDKLLMTIAKSRRPKLEIFSVRSYWQKINVLHLQPIADRCPNLRKLGGIDDAVRNQLRFPKYRKVALWICVFGNTISMMNTTEGLI